MTDTTMEKRLPGEAVTSNAPSPLLVAIKETIFTAVLVFLLGILMVGFQTQAIQGQYLSFVTRFSDVIWAVAIVPIGRFLLALDRQGISWPALIVGGLAFLYFFGAGSTGVMELDVYKTLPLPFEEPMVNVIFGLGALLVCGTAIKSIRTAGEGRQTLPAREAAEARRANFAKRLSGVLGPALVAIAIVLPWTPWGDRQLVDSLILVLTYVMLGWGLNIVVGLAGLLDLGYVAFYAVGAYTYAKLSTELGLSFWESLPIAGALAAAFGVTLGFPVLRLRGDYLAIVTLGFGEMIRIVLINWQVFTGGPNGIGSIGKITFFGFPFERKVPEGVTAFHDLFGLQFSGAHRVYFLYYVILVLALITNFVTIRLRKLPIGRAWEALREDETACRALGINPTNTKLTAFALGAMFAGFAGSFFATRQGFVSPESFTFIESAVILAIVVLGGMGSQVGVALAAILLIGLPEALRELALYRMLAFGASMVLIMLWRPKGLLSYREPTILLHAKNKKAMVSGTVK
ncbi:high-affinity branched-chain amino acid ABC transporter permease LivM [Dongia soli]|uniref:High-affinity branched-chain amino acid ABC transporter permease LivM n=1 Tax=Dongia soli TaxID=600628 RepID=A0ABU5EBH6_9PROT|nr:high-affinity branched-chain amino acid ABC transporter permease LivM [Dongia soli]MDY0883237.1 high-affinity branched-chain amino acid ABC transporter permease LivM [Dongia soli]